MEVPSGQGLVRCPGGVDPVLVGVGVRMSGEAGMGGNSTDRRLTTLGCPKVIIEPWLQGKIIGLHGQSQPTTRTNLPVEIQDYLRDLPSQGIWIAIEGSVMAALEEEEILIPTSPHMEGGVEVGVLAMPTTDIGIARVEVVVSAQSGVIVPITQGRDAVLAVTVIEMEIRRPITAGNPGFNRFHIRSSYFELRKIS